MGKARSIAVGVLALSMALVGAASPPTDNMPPSTWPPGGLNVSEVPQFVILGVDDNWSEPGLTWWTVDLFQGMINPAGTGNAATYDGTSARASFYVLGEKIQ
ncbi:MAG: hypothetical protein HYY16_08750, partial [Planctomycetes bacterium]|nr:hypothetical protein [Planctomycetota bacterium]